MMTGNDEALSMSAIDLVRNLQRTLANECFAKGISPEDITLATLHATFDLAEATAGPGVTAVEWLRTGIDTIERQLLTDARAHSSRSAGR